MYVYTIFCKILNGPLSSSVGRSSNNFIKRAGMLPFYAPLGALVLLLLADCVLYYSHILKSGFKVFISKIYY